MAGEITPEEGVSLRDQLKELLKPELLVQIHDVRFPWPKASKLDWQEVVNNLWDDGPERKQVLYKLMFPVWSAMSKMPLEELKEIDMRDFLPDRDAPDYPEQCAGLVYMFDQTKTFLRGTDIRYTSGFFDPLAEQLAMELFDDQSGGHGIPSPKSPFSKEAWLSRGYTFEDYAARVDWIWAALIHSETSMSEQRSLNQGFLHHLRAEVEQYSGERDPYAETEATDEKNLLLSSQINERGPPSKEQLGRDLDITDHMFWMLRMMTAHFPIIDRFGRYPYWNDLLGRDFNDEELEWMQTTGYQRLPEPLRSVSRMEGAWAPLKGNPEFD